MEKFKTFTRKQCVRISKLVKINRPEYHNESCKEFYEDEGEGSYAGQTLSKI